MRSAWRGLAIVGLASMAIFVVAACGGKSKSSESTFHHDIVRLPDGRRRRS